MSEVQNFNKYLFWGAVVLLLFLSYLIVKPFFIALISAFILAYLVKPVYNRMSRKVGKSFAAVISVIIVVLVIVAPFLFIIEELARQIFESLNKESIGAIISGFSSLPFFNSLNLQTSDLTQKAFSFAFSFAESLVTGLPTLIISVAVILLGIYYILKNWDFLVLRIKSYIPFKDKERVISEMGRATNRIIYGYALIALIDFSIAFIGFYIVGVKYVTLLSALIALLAFIPAAGPMLVWLPLAIYYLATGHMAIGIGVGIVGIIMSVLVDNLLAPQILGKASNIHPLIMFIGVLGGISVFGLFGFIIGPLVLAYTLEILEEIKKGNS